MVEAFRDIGVPPSMLFTFSSGKCDAVHLTGLPACPMLDQSPSSPPDFGAHLRSLEANAMEVVAPLVRANSHMPLLRNSVKPRKGSAA